MTIKGEIWEETRDEKATYHELRYRAAQRTIPLPVEVNPDAAEVIFENGLLKLTLPNVGGEKAKHIKISKS